MTPRHSVLLVCDASRERGSGHVMRMITLGASLIELGADATMAAHDLPESLRDLAARRGLRLVTRRSEQSDPSLAGEIQTREHSAIVIDGYDVDPRAFDELTARGERVVVIDDNGDHAGVPCSMIVNPNLHASPKMYADNRLDPVLLLGTTYALIRPEIRVAHVPPIRERSGVLLSLGGTDVLGRRAEIEQHLRRHRPWAVTTAMGLIGTATTSADEMARALASSRVGLIAVGTTTWEALCLGLPIVGLVVADNQVRVAQSLQAVGLATSFDLRVESDLSSLTAALSTLHDSPDMLEERSVRGRSLVDGFGADRVALAVLDR